MAFINTVGLYGVSTGLSALSSLNSGLTQASQFGVMAGKADVQRYAAQVNQRIAKLTGEQTALSLDKEFNKTMANNAVMAAAQGRSGGSVAAAANAAEDQYKFDLEMADIATDIQMGNYKMQEAQSIADAKIYKTSQKIAKRGAYTNVLFGGINSATKYGLLGGK